MKTTIKDTFTQMVIEGSNRNIEIKYTLKEGNAYFNFKGQRLQLSNFIRTESPWGTYKEISKAGFHGIYHTSYSTGYLVKISDSGDTVQCYTFKSESV